MKNWNFKKIILWVLGLVIAAIVINSAVTYFQENGSAEPVAPETLSAQAGSIGEREEEVNTRGKKVNTYTDTGLGGYGGGTGSGGSGGAGSSGGSGNDRFRFTIGGATFSPGLSNGMPVVRVKLRF